MNERKRVLYLCAWPIGAGGEGAVSFVHEQIVELSSKVDALYLEHSFLPLLRVLRQPQRALSPVRVLTGWPEAVRALRVHTVRFPTRLSRRSFLEDVRGAGRGIARRLRLYAERVDLVHAHVVLPAGLLGTQIAAEMRVPFILQEHSGPFDMHLDTKEKCEAVRETISAATQILAVGEPLGRQLRSIATKPERVMVTPNLVRTDLFKPTPFHSRLNDLHLVTVGSLVSIKDHKTLIDCVGILLQRGMAVRLTIIGDGPLRTSLEQQVFDLGLTGAVTFRGHLSRAETAHAIAQSHIYVCSSLVETFGLAVAEALSCGRPVVATRCGGPETFIETDSGLLCRAGDAGDMAQTVDQLVSMLHLIRPQVLHRRMDERFGPNAFRQRMLNVYSTAVDGAT